MSIFFPAYNEEKNIKRTISQATVAASYITRDYEIIIVDDGSQDNTAGVVETLAKKDKHLRLVKHDKNKGYGAAVKTGLASCKKDWIFFSDSDGQFDLGELPGFVSHKTGVDFVIGYRVKRQDPLHRIFIAQVLLKLWNYLLFGLKVRDVDCAFKLIKRESLKTIKLETSSAITVTELLVKLIKAGYSYKQVPVSHYPRKFGEQTGGNIGVILKAVKESLSLWLSMQNKNSSS